jgi:hypothetical protein
MELFSFRGPRRAPADIAADVQRAFSKWLEGEGLLGRRAEKSSFEAQSDLSETKRKVSEGSLALTDGDTLRLFVPHFEAGLLVERMPIHERPGAPFDEKRVRVEAAFAQGRFAEGEGLGRPILEISLPQSRVMVQRARVQGGVIEQLGLRSIRVWKEPFLIFIPTSSARSLIFICDRPDPFQRHIAEEAGQIVSLIRQAPGRV